MTSSDKSNCFHQTQHLRKTQNLRAHLKPPPPPPPLGLADFPIKENDLGHYRYKEVIIVGTLPDSLREWEP